MELPSPWGMRMKAGSVLMMHPGKCRVIQRPVCFQTPDSGQDTQKEGFHSVNLSACTRVHMYPLYVCTRMYAYVPSIRMYA